MRKIIIAISLCLIATTCRAEWDEFRFDRMKDVNVDQVTLADGDISIYDGTFQYWKNVTIVAGLGGTFLMLDQTPPQTITASPIFDWGTATRVPFYSATKTLTDDADLTFDGTNLTVGGVKSNTGFLDTRTSSSTYSILGVRGATNDGLKYTYSASSNELGIYVNSLEYFRASHSAFGDYNYFFKPISFEGISVYGNTIASGNLLLSSTVNATKGKIYFGGNDYYNEVTQQYTSVLADGGLSPFSITSKVVNTNLNADLWDGYQFSDYLDQAVKTTSSPVFAGIDLTGLTDGYLPYVGVGALANSPIYTDGTNVAVNWSGVIASTLHIATINAGGATIQALTGNTGDYCGIKFKVSADTSTGYRKGGMFFKRIGSSSRGEFHFAINNVDDNTSVLLADSKLMINGEGNVAIGTTDLDGTPAVGRLTVKGTTNDGSTYAQVWRDSDEANVASVDTNGNYTSIPSDSIIKAGTLITTDTTKVLAMNLINNAKGELIEDINNLVGTANIKGFWVFDQTGATTSITGRDPDGTVCTLGGNASTLTPAVSGLCPNLTMNGTAATAWSVADADKYSFGDGAGNDSAFTVIALVNPVDATSLNFAVKGNANLWEWVLQTSAGDKLYFSLYNNDATKGIQRYYNTAITTDEGSWHCYSGTASGGSPQAIAGLKIYRDGVQVDNTSNTVGVYAGMTNNMAVVANSYNNASNWSKSKYGVVLIINKELTAAEVKRVSDRLRLYAGSFL